MENLGKEVSLHEQQQLIGGEPLTMSAVLMYIAIAAGVTAILRVAFSASGRVNLPGISFQWTN